MTHVHVFDGLRPEPLGSYLSAVGVLRLIGEQADATAAGRWHNDRFELRTSLTADEVVDFFLDRYEPTPLVAPWNGGSGFHPKDNTSARDTILGSDDPRLAPYRSTIDAADELMTRPEWPGDLTKHKAVCVELCRAWLPDEALKWVDAAVVLTDVREGREFPPLLGTGGNVGRLEFTNNFMQRLVDVLAIGDGRRAATRDDSKRWLDAQLFGRAAAMAKQPVGQFDPSAAGGANMGPLAADALVNPWGYVLMLEGAVVFASGTARRLGSETGSAAAMPFTVRPSAVGYASASDGESVKGELWLPLWANFCSKDEIERTIREGRLSWGRRQAVDGLDAARAVATLGTDRGLAGFARFVIAERLGQAMLAVPVGRVSATELNADMVAVTAMLDGWIDKCRRIKLKPAAIVAAIHAYETALFGLADRPAAEQLLDVLTAAATLDAGIGRSGAARDAIRPLLLREAEVWTKLLPFDAKEVRLAAAVASSSVEGVTAAEQLRPIERELGRGRLAWRERGSLVEASPKLDDRLSALLQLRSRTLGASGRQATADAAIRGVDLRPACRLPARADDVDAFVAGDVDITLFRRALDALLLLDWRSTTGAVEVADGSGDHLAPALAILAPFTCAAPWAQEWKNRLGTIVAGADWGRLLESGRVDDVVADANRRLRAAGRRPLVRSSLPRTPPGGRLAAALAIPVHPRAAVDALDDVAPLTNSTQEELQEQM